MDESIQNQLDILAQRIASAISDKHATSLQVHHRHHNGSSVFCLGRYGGMKLVEAASPIELIAHGSGFLAGLTFYYPIVPGQLTPYWHAEGWA